MKIETQNIYGGSQQFADSIVNQNPKINFDEHDIHLLKFIGNIEDNEKDEIANDVVSIANRDLLSIERTGATERVKKFIINHKEDAIKWSSIIGKTALAIILAKFGLSLADIGLE